MKKEEKTKQTCEKIIQAAIIEFGTKNYEAASINSICSENQISKGLIYHNFENKDALYLSCVTLCFQEMSNYLLRCGCEPDTPEDGIQKLLQARQLFFNENPYYRNIFFNAVLQPPVHLQGEIRKIRSELDRCNKAYYEALLSRVQLRDGITRDMAIEYFMIFQDMYNGYYQNKAYENKDFQSFIDDHELKISRLLDIMLYGIVDTRS